MNIQFLIFPRKGGKIFLNCRQLRFEILISFLVVFERVWVRHGVYELGNLIPNVEVIFCCASETRSIWWHWTDFAFQIHIVGKLVNPINDSKLLFENLFLWLIFKALAYLEYFFRFDVEIKELIWLRFHLGKEWVQRIVFWLESNLFSWIAHWKPRWRLFDVLSNSLW